MAPLLAVVALAGACGDGDGGAESVVAPTTATAAPVEPSEQPEEPASTVAVLFVGHGEPTTFADGDVAIRFVDGGTFGPFGQSLDVPRDAQSTEWAAAYEEIATAMTYLFGDVNGNDVDRELMVSPAGDVPPFFTWDAFRATLRETYDAFGDRSPHNDLLAEHIESLDVDIDGMGVNTYLAFLDAVPRIPDVISEILLDDDGPYDKIVVVPMLLASSTHTQEVADQIEEVVQQHPGMELTVASPFYEVPFMRDRVADAIVAMIDYLHGSIPADVADENVGVLLAAHGTPYVPADPELGWREGDIYSDLSVVESDFHDELASALPWAVRTGRMNYATPTIEESLAAFEADGMEHVLVIPSAFPTAAMHTMWDVAEPAVGRAVTPDEGIVSSTRPSGMTVHYSAEGYADLESGRAAFRAGLEFIAESGLAVLLDAEPGDQP